MLSKHMTLGTSCEQERGSRRREQKLAEREEGAAKTVFQWEMGPKESRTREGGKPERSRERTAQMMLVVPIRSLYPNCH